MIIFNLQLLFVRVSGAETLFFLHWALMVMVLFFSVCTVLLLRLHLVCVDQKEKNCSHENQFSSISQIKGVVRWESLTTTNWCFPPTHPCLAFQLFPRGKFPCSQSEVEEQKSLDSLIKEQMEILAHRLFEITASSLIGKLKKSTGFPMVPSTSVRDFWFWRSGGE